MKIKPLIDKIILQEMKNSIIDTVKRRIPNFNNKPMISDENTVKKESIPFFVSDLSKDKYRILIKLMANSNRRAESGLSFKNFPTAKESNPKFTNEVPVIYLNHLANLIILDHDLKMDKQTYRYFRGKIMVFVMDYLKSIGYIPGIDFEFDLSGIKNF